MTRYVVRRLLELIPVLLVASILVWLMMYAVPGDPATVRLGADATPEQIAAEREKLALDDPIVVQYGYWVANVLRGDFGTSIANGESVLTLIRLAFPVTLSLTLSGMVLAIVIGFPLGIIAAIRQTHFVTGGVSLYTALALAIPTFWIGMLLVWLFAIHLSVLPASGYVAMAESPRGFLRHMTLPAVTLAIFASGIIARFVAASMADASRQDYLWTARAKGLSESQVMRRHAFRNALIPAITVIGLQFGILLGGAIIVEAVFNLPGMGRLLFDSVARRDYAVVQGVVLLLVLAVGIMNVTVDLLYGVLDPRIRH